jgi:POT family proton-dependent oligopeptide transporter
MAKYTPRIEPSHENKGWPTGIPFIIGNEGCERFSYYGMKAILFVYITGLYMNMQGLDLKIARDSATEVMHLWSAAVYTLPLIGAIVADRLLGKYRTILYLSVVYCFGHLALALFEDPHLQQSLFGEVYIDPLQGLFIGLGLIALGSGGIKPCVSAHVGDQFGRANWSRLQTVYNAFYFIINFGSAFATILIPIIRGTVMEGPGGIRYYDGSVGWAFGIPGILMGLATIFFWAGRKKFIHVPATSPGLPGVLDVASGTSLFLGLLAVPIWGHDLFVHYFPALGVGLTVGVSVGFVVLFYFLYTARSRIEQDDGFLAMTFFCLQSRLSKRAPEPGSAPEAGGRDLREHYFYGPAARRFGSRLTEGPVAVWKIISVFFLVSVFWGLFHQHSSTWVAQAREMDRSVDMSLAGWLITGALLGLMVAHAISLVYAQRGGRLAKSLAIGGGAGAVLGYLAAAGGPYTLEASQVPAVNPFMVMLLIAYTRYGLYPALERRGHDVSPLRRMTIGMGMAGIAFGAVALLQMVMDAAPQGQPVHVGWQLIPYFIITLSEVMVSITGLEFAYSQAPKRMKSVIMGFWLLSVAVGDLLVVFVTRMQFESVANFFWFFAAMMVIAALLFGVRARTYTYQDYTQ